MGRYLPSSANPPWKQPIWSLIKVSIESTDVKKKRRGRTRGRAGGREGGRDWRARFHGAQPLSAAANPLLSLNALSPPVKGAFHGSSSALERCFCFFPFFPQLLTKVHLAGSAWGREGCCPSPASAAEVSEPRWTRALERKKVRSFRWP